MLCLSGLELYSRWVPLRVNRTELCMEPVHFPYLSHLLYGICVKVFIMNRYISNSYTTSLNAIDRRTIYRAEAAVVSTITNIYLSC